MNIFINNKLHYYYYPKYIFLEENSENRWIVYFFIRIEINFYVFNIKIYS